LSNGKKDKIMKAELLKNRIHFRLKDNRGIQFNLSVDDWYDDIKVRDETLIYFKGYYMEKTNVPVLGTQKYIVRGKFLQPAREILVVLNPENKKWAIGVDRFSVLENYKKGIQYA
jgi:hypothetical protein